MPTPTSHPPVPHRQPRRLGFTLLEMLVVISIIVVLIGLLLPVMGKVRQQARAAETRNRIAALTAAIQAYYGDYNAYPGPVSNPQLGTPAASIVGVKDMDGTAITPPNMDQMTMAENLFIGLMGGLEPTAAGATTFEYQLVKAGTGPRSLGGVPKRRPAYVDGMTYTDAASKGHFVDADGNAANDTNIPELLDTFPEALPVLYLRARTGAPGVASEDNVATAGTPPQQYDVDQVAGYTDTQIGVGKAVPQSKYTTPGDFPKHGLRTANEKATIAPPPSPNPLGLVKAYPYDLYAALLDPNITRVNATPAAPANNPRQKDGFILISAGIDRVYGTEDDIANFGNY